jgi:hypothetical protein
MIRPWIGSRWGDHENLLAGVKLLILGESAHSEQDERWSQPPDLLERVIQKYVAERPNYRFHTVLTALLAGANASWQITPEQRREVWDSVAFCNYVPVVAARYSRERPTPEMFKAGVPYFAHILDTHKPQAVLACGFNTWGWLMWGLSNGAGKPWEVPSPQRIGPAIAARIKHPSTGFSYGNCRPVVDDLVQRARALS